MSTINTTSGALKQQSVSARFWLVGVGVIIAAVVMNTIITLAAHAVLTVAPTFTPLQFYAAIPTTVVAVVGALVVFALITRRSQQPVRLFQRIALVVLVVSLVPDVVLAITHVYPGTTLAEVGTLMLMHIATGLLVISMAPRMIDARG